MQNIMDMVGAQFGRDTVDAVAGWAGESREGTRRALDVAIPASIVGIADHADGENSASDLIARFRAGDHRWFEGNNLVDVLRQPGHGEEVVRGGQDMAQQLFGAREGGVVDGIASTAGIGGMGARRILALVVPAILGIVGKQALASRMDGRGLASYLSRQKEMVAGLLPASLAPLLGLSRPVAEPIRIARAERRVPVDVEPRRDWTRAIPWVVGALALLIGIVWVAGNRRVTKHRSMPTVGEATRDREPWRTRMPGMAHDRFPETVKVVPLPVLPPPVILTPPSVATTEPEPDTSATPSPDGTSSVDEQGPAAMISRYLDTDPGRTQELSLEVVNFETGSAELDGDDEQILDGVAEVLRDRPDTEVVIEGHADSVGGRAINRRLSKARAEAVERYLVDREVDPDQLKAVGKSSRRPVKPNDSDMHRAENRRVDMVVKHV